MLTSQVIIALTVIYYYYRLLSLSQNNCVTCTYTYELIKPKMYFKTIKMYKKQKYKKFK